MTPTDGNYSNNLTAKEVHWQAFHKKHLYQSFQSRNYESQIYMKNV